jgi:hypothetical protein
MIARVVPYLLKLNLQALKAKAGPDQVLLCQQTLHFWMAADPRLLMGKSLIVGPKYPARPLSI